MPRPPIIIGGAPRSGTTLLRLIVDSHPNIVCGPEMKILPAICQAFFDHNRIYGAYLTEQFGIARATHARVFGDHIRGILEDYRLRSGKQRVAEKTPDNIFYFPQLAELMPDSPLVHIIRDGREVILSMMRTNWIEADTGARPAIAQDVSAAARYWVKAVTFGRRARAHPGVLYHELRYEDLTRNLEATMRAFLDFVGEPWSRDVIEYDRREHHLSPGDYVSQGFEAVRPIAPKPSGAWRTLWSRDEIEAVRSIAGGLLVELGYSNGSDW